MKYFALAALGLLAAAPSSATTVSWADLTSYDPVTGVVDGTITTSTGSVGLTVAGGGYSFVQLGGPGDTNYWTQPNPASLPYTGGTVSDAPPTTDIIALNAGGTKTITFSQAVTDPYLALVSWNGNSGVFDQALTTISSGCGYWGCGTFGDVTDHSFTGQGELHGIIQFHGTFTQVTFTDLTENWHGIEVGIGGIAPPPAVPEPATWAMFIGGFGVIGASMRRRQRTKVAFV
jgi:hypothetical protein